MQAILDAIPEMVLSSISSSIQLPEVVDNSQNIFMRPIFDQEGGCCNQAAGIGYVFTYEINWLRNLSSNVIENQYPTHYTYNFLNGGNGGISSWFIHGWNIVKENGCPNVPTWGGMAGDPTRWMTGYENYLSGMYNKLDYYYHFHVGTPGEFEGFKHWINDHNSGTDIGGLGLFNIDMTGIVYDELPPESVEAGKRIIADWEWDISGIPANHSMTFVGYNDNIKYDINNDGLFTNDLDTNGDGIVDMLDWEIGALKVANSWGLIWPGGQNSDGFSYLPYRLLPKTVYNPEDPLDSVCVISEKKAYVLLAKQENIPELTVKVNVDYPCRVKLEFMVGYANNVNQIAPIVSTAYSSFKNQGGCLPMQGIDNYVPIEVGLDFGYWYLNDDFGKIFFKIVENTNYGVYDGTVNYFSFIDNRWGETFELYCDATNVPIVNDGETVLSIDYDLIPHEVAIDEDLSLFSNMVSRFNPTVTNGATVTVEDGVGIDMYNSEIHIMAGSTLVIEDNAVITAKRGRCKLIIDGNLICGSNVRFEAVEDADLELLLNNNSLQVTFGNSSFEKIRLDSYAQSLILSNSEFRNCIMISSHRGNVTVNNNCTFIGTGLYVENTEDNNNTATISNCSFTNNLFIAAIDVWNYNQYDISNNTINGYYNGIQIVQSGYGLTKKQTIQDNTITNCSQKGILAYNTLGSVYRNHISNNNFGVWFGDHSGIKLYGNSGAVNNNQTQEICNNASYEVYASQYSFPVYFRYNVIIDEDNTGAPDDPLVYYSAGSGDNNLRDVSRNCWGQNFNATEDLYPSGYVWMPTWCPGIGDSNNPPADEDMYEVASSLFENENYVGAKSVYEMLIDEYPDSKFAKAALQELFALEKFVSDDYSSLKQYYATNSAIQSDSILGKTAHHLASKCDVKTENWADAISYYENIILNPETMEDSIFAIIDLGYVYFVMENSGYKSAYSGQLTQYKPETLDQFIKNRDYLISLLPGDKKSKTINENVAGLKEGELMQNEPNPFTSTTRAGFKINKESDVKISISDYKGKALKTLYYGKKDKGYYDVAFSSQGFAPGIYFYTLIIDNIPIESRKMIILK